jgi:hypothetical protein
LQDPPKFTQIVIFGLTIHHLATLNSGPIWSRLTEKNSSSLFYNHNVKQ